jgi:hypothetical protein
MLTSRFRRVAARVFLALACFPACAAPPLTTVQDLLYTADGRTFNGLAIIRWSSFVASDGSSVAAGSRTVRIVDGVVRVRLVPTANSIPSSYYSVRFNSDGKTQFVETWAVPASNVKTLTTVRGRTTQVVGGDTGRSRSPV